VVSASAACLRLAGSGNAGFLTTPAVAALTAAQFAALRSLGSLMDEHRRDPGGAAQTYDTADGPPMIGR
jgi:hypothetical protein